MNTDNNDIISLHDIAKFFILNGRKILILWLIFLILCIAGVYWAYQAKKMFYVSVEIPFSYNKTSEGLQPESLIDKLQLNQAIEWLYLPEFQRSITNDENKAIANSIQLVKTDKDRTGEREKFILLLQGVYLEKNTQIDRVLSDFVIFIENGIDKITSPLNLSIQNHIKAAEHSYQNSLKQAKMEVESQLKTIQEKHVQELKAWQANLSFQQNQQREIESMIARIEKSIINDSKESNMYFLLKQDFLYIKLYDIQKEAFLLQEKIKNADADLALQIDNIKRQNVLSVIEINNKYQPIIMNLEIELKTINKAHAIYYFSNQTQGLSLSALYLLSLLLSLILAVVSTYIISLFTTVKKGIH